MTRLKGLYARSKGRITTTIAGIVVVGAFAIVMVGHHAVSNEVISAQPDTAWFSSSGTGSVSLLDGLTLTRAAYLQNVAPADDTIQTVQSGAGAYLVDLTRGTVTTLDGELLEAGKTVSFGSPAYASGLQIFSNGSVSWIETGSSIGDDSVQQVNPATLGPIGRPIVSSKTLQQVALAPNGVLWSIDKDGDVDSYAGAALRSQANIGYSGQADLVMQGNTPVVVTQSFSRSQVLVLNPASGEVQSTFNLSIPVTTSGWVTAGSSGVVSVLDEGSDHIQIFDSATGSIVSSQLGIQEPSTPDVLGTPVITGGVIYVPDVTSGKVYLVRASNGHLLNVFPLDVDRMAFYLTVQHDFVWYDVPTSYQTGVITLNGPEPILVSGSSTTATSAPPPVQKNKNTAGSTPSSTSGSGTVPTSTSTTVSTSNEVTVPYIVGLSSTEALGDLEAAGLTCSGCTGGGTVATQSPAANKKVPFGTTVDVTLGVPRLPQVIGSTLPPAQVGQNYEGQLEATGGTGVLVFTIIPPEPGSWLALNGGSVEENGDFDQPLNGMPSDPGTVTFSAFVTDSAGAQSATVNFSITVGDNQGSQPDAYITQPQQNAVTVVDTGTAGIVSSSIPVGQEPVAVAITPNGADAYVLNAQGNGGADGTITVINTQKNTPSGDQITVGINPSAIAISPNGASAYVVNEGSDNVSVIDTATGAVTKTIAVGGGPDSIAITPNGATAYVANGTSDSISVISTSSGQVGTITSNLGLDPVAIAVTPSGQYAYIVCEDSDGVSVLNTSSGSISASAVQTGFKPTGIAITPDGKTAYVANSESGTATVISTSNQTVAGTITVGNSPQFVAVTPNGEYAYVTDTQSKQVSLIDTADNETETPVVIGSNPAGLAITPDQAPAATLYTSPAPAGSVTTFNATGSQAVSSPIASYAWKFGDGSALKKTSVPVITHVYAKAGNYKVQLTETDEAGTSTTVVFTGQTVSLDGGPQASTSSEVSIPAAQKGSPIRTPGYRSLSAVSYRREVNRLQVPS
ncbi:MAG: PKD domain-containing protein [Acidimicrobiales bacterium]